MPRQPQVPEPYTHASRGLRLQKVLAAAGVASRRDAEQLITAGRVTVNGERVMALPAWVDPVNDRIEVDGQPIRRTAARPRAREMLYIALHKPRRTISTTQDDLGRATVLDVIDLPEHAGKRLFPVGRLDAESTGLILLTNDGELANRLTHPRYEIPKQYIVSVRGKLSAEEVETLRQGLYLAHRRTGERNPQVKKASMASVKFLGYTTDRRAGDRTQLEVTLREGQNREIRRMLAQLGHKVRKLQRIAIGPLKLKGLGIGQYRILQPMEVSALYRAAGLDKPDKKPPGPAPKRSSDRRQRPAR